MMKTQIILDTSVLEEGTRSVVDRYLLGEISAVQACNLLGWHGGHWEKHMAGVISSVKSEGGINLLIIPDFEDREYEWQYQLHMMFKGAGWLGDEIFHTFTKEQAWIVYNFLMERIESRMLEEWNQDMTSPQVKRYFEEKERLKGGE